MHKLKVGCRSLRCGNGKRRIVSGINRNIGNEGGYIKGIYRGVGK